MALTPLLIALHPCRTSMAGVAMASLITGVGVINPQLPTAAAVTRATSISDVVVAKVLPTVMDAVTDRSTTVAVVALAAPASAVMDVLIVERP